MGHALHLTDSRPRVLLRKRLRRCGFCLFGCLLLSCAFIFSVPSVCVCVSLSVCVCLLSHTVCRREKAKALPSALTLSNLDPTSLRDTPPSSRQPFVYIVLFTSPSWPAGAMLISNTRVKILICSVASDKGPAQRFSSSTDETQPA